jgi:hypothetical protein
MDVSLDTISLRSRQDLRPSDPGAKLKVARIALSSQTALPVRFLRIRTVMQKKEEQGSAAPYEPVEENESAVGFELSF